MKKPVSHYFEIVLSALKKLPPKSRLFLGVAALAALTLLFTIPEKKTAQTSIPTAAEGEYAEEYRQKTEERLARLLSGMEGVGEVQLMVTLEGTGEILYAQTQKSENTSTGEGEESFSRRATYENDYVLVSTDSNGRQLVTTGTVLPSVQGVVVVCTGANDITVQKNVTEAVCVALGIPSNRVCVKQLS